MYTKLLDIFSIRYIEAERSGPTPENTPPESSVDNDEAFIKNECRKIYDQVVAAGSHDAAQKIIDDYIKTLNIKPHKEGEYEWSKEGDLRDKVLHLVGDVYGEDGKLKPQHDLARIRYNIGIHESPDQFIADDIKVRTKDLYNQVLACKSIGEARELLNNNDSLFKNILNPLDNKDNKYIPLFTNIATLRYSLGDIFNGVPDGFGYQDKLIRIQKSIGIYEGDIQERMREKEFLENKEFPTDITQLAYRLSDLVINRKMTNKEFEKLIDYYQQNAPSATKEKYLTMIRVANNIALNNPEFRAQEDTHSQTSILGKDTDTSAMSSPNPNQRDILADALQNKTNPQINDNENTQAIKKDFVTLGLLQAGNGKPGETLGNADSFQEVRGLTDDQKEFLKYYHPRAIYQLMFQRFSEYLQSSDGKIAEPKEIVESVGQLIDSKHFSGPIKELYANLFNKVVAFLNSGILDHPQGKEILIKLGTVSKQRLEREASQRTESNPGTLFRQMELTELDNDVFGEFQKVMDESIVNKGSFAVEQGKLRFYKVSEIGEAIRSGKLKQNEGMQMAIQGFIKLQGGNLGFDEILGSIIGDDESMGMVFAQFYNKLDIATRSMIIPQDKQASFMQYLNKKGYIQSNTGREEIPFSKSSIQEKFPNIATELGKKYNNVEKIPLDARGNVDVGMFMQMLLKENPTYEECVKLKELIIKDLKDGIGKLEINMRTLEAEIFRDLQKFKKSNEVLAKNISLKEIFALLNLKASNAPHFDVGLTSLNDASEKNLLAILETLNTASTGANSEQRAIIDKLRALVQQSVERRNLAVSVKIVEDISARDMHQNPKEVGKAVHAGEDVLKASGETKRNDEDIKSIVGKLPQEFLTSKGLPRDVAAYKSPAVREQLQKVIAELSPEEKEKYEASLKAILNRIESNDEHAKKAIAATETLTTIGYTETLGNIQSDLKFLQDIPKDKLAEYEQAIRTEQKNLESISQIETGKPLSVSEIKEFSNISLTNIPANTAIVKNPDGSYTISLQDPESKQQYSIDGIKESNLAQKAKDIDTLCEIKAHALLPYISMIRTIIPENPRLQKISAESEYDQSKLQLIAAVNILIGDDSMKNLPSTDIIRKFQKNNTSQDVFHMLQQRAIFDDGGTLSYIRLRQAIQEKPINIEQMSLEEVMQTFLSPQQRSKLTHIKNPEIQKQLSIEIQKAILDLKKSLGEVNSKNIDKYRKLFSEKFEGFLGQDSLQ